MRKSFDVSLVLELLLLFGVCGVLIGYFESFLARHPEWITISNSFC